jgi:hypothetical protein
LARTAAAVFRDRARAYGCVADSADVLSVPSSGSDSE